jgi:hypothetical protein
MAELENENVNIRKRIEETSRKWNENMMLFFVIGIILSVIASAGLVVTRLYLYQ